MSPNINNGGWFKQEQHTISNGSTNDKIGVNLE